MQLLHLCCRLLEFCSHEYIFTVHMKLSLFLHSYKMYRSECTIPNFEMARTKIGNFTSPESWAILPPKNGQRTGLSLLQNSLVVT